MKSLSILPLLLIATAIGLASAQRDCPRISASTRQRTSWTSDGDEYFLYDLTFANLYTHPVSNIVFGLHAASGNASITQEWNLVELPSSDSSEAVFTIVEEGQRHSLTIEPGQSWSGSGYVSAGALTSFTATITCTFSSYDSYDHSASGSSSSESASASSSSESASASSSESASASSSESSSASASSSESASASSSESASASSSESASASSSSESASASSSESSSASSSESASSGSSECTVVMASFGSYAPWNDGVFYYQQFDFKVDNTGSESVDSAMVTIDFDSTLLTVDQSWNIDLKDSTSGLFSVSLFGLAAGQSFTGAGMIFKIKMSDMPASYSFFSDIQVQSSSC